VGRARLARVNRELAALIGLATIALAWFSNGDSNRAPTPTRPRLARGSGDPRTNTIAFAFSPDGNMIATSHEDGHVALRSAGSVGHHQMMTDAMVLASEPTRQLRAAYS
jgi:hypothetical protein